MSPDPLVMTERSVVAAVTGEVKSTVGSEPKSPETSTLSELAPEAAGVQSAAPDSSGDEGLQATNERATPARMKEVRSFFDTGLLSRNLGAGSDQSGRPT